MRLDAENAARLVALLRDQRWACLGTLQDGAPFVSWVAYAVTAEGDVLLHLSGLAQHTRNIRVDGRASLAVSEPDDGRQDDPQELARVTLQGEVQPLSRTCHEYETARALYLCRLPTAASLFEFGDFELYRLRPVRLRYVAGFDSTHGLDGGQWRGLWIKDHSN